jgi:hypothetical protein
MDSFIQKALFETLPTLGIGGLLAGFMFYFYRKDSKEWIARWEVQSQIWMKIVQDNTSAIVRLEERLSRRRDEE